MAAENASPDNKRQKVDLRLSVLTLSLVLGRFAGVGALPTLSLLSPLYCSSSRTKSANSSRLILENDFWGKKEKMKFKIKINIFRFDLLNLQDDLHRGVEGGSES